MQKTIDINRIILITKKMYDADDFLDELGDDGPPELLLVPIQP